MSQPQKQAGTKESRYCEMNRPHTSGAKGRRWPGPHWAGLQVLALPSPCGKVGRRQLGPKGKRKREPRPPPSESRGPTPFAFAPATAAFWRRASGRAGGPGPFWRREKSLQEGRGTGKHSRGNSCFSGLRGGVLIRLRWKLVCERPGPRHALLDTRKMEAVK